MRALVTGSAGFLGRHFCTVLQSRGWDVTGWDVVEGRDMLDLLPATTRRFDLVVHAAAYEPHRAAIDGDHTHLARNLRLDATMFCWAQLTGSRLLYLSSSAAYPVGLQTGDPPLRLGEDTTGSRVAEPDAGYGWAKLSGERMAADAAGAGLAVHVVRPFSGYGSNQDTRWPFGAFADRARRHRDPFEIWGPGTQVRDWVHVDDVIGACLAVVDQDVRGPVNICTGVGTSMLELAGLMCAVIGYRPRFAPLSDKPAGVQYRVGDPARLHEVYVPKVDLADGVRRALSV